MSKIQLSQQAFEMIREHAEAAYPFECCGFMFGTDGEVRQVNHCTQATNHQPDGRTDRFVISPLDYLNAEQYAATNNTGLLGIYHSHPDHPAIASATDLKYAQPYFSYVIVSIKGGKLADTKSWKLNNENKFHEEQIII